VCLQTITRRIRKLEETKTSVENTLKFWSECPLREDSDGSDDEDDDQSSQSFPSEQEVHTDDSDEVEDSDDS